MANLKLSQLPAAAGLTGTEVLPVVQAGQTRSTTAAALADLRKGAWQTPILNAPWSNFGDVFATAAYRKDASRVQLRGLVKGGTGGSVLFTMPPGFRPQAQQVYVAACDATTPARIDIKPSGDIIIMQPASQVLAWLSLDSIGFYEG